MLPSGDVVRQLSMLPPGWLGIDSMSFAMHLPRLAPASFSLSIICSCAFPAMTMLEHTTSPCNLTAAAGAAQPVLHTITCTGVQFVASSLPVSLMCMFVAVTRTSAGVQKFLDCDVENTGDKMLTCLVPLQGPQHSVDHGVMGLL